jgi:hypothetical protein
MLDGVMLLWWILTVPSFLFVVIDIWRTTPESPVLKWAFVILTAFTGPFGAFFYVVGCREPLRGTHEKYVATRWRQVLGSTMHCVAGGSYLKSLKMTFLPELLSMNLLMTGMVITSQFAMRSVRGSDDPTRPQFWFIMSMALIVGFVCAYPANWWLVANHMKHGMMTVPMGAMSSDMSTGSGSAQHQPGPATKAAITAVTFAILGAALVLVMQFAMSN